jgi:putative zinc finger/helix-turn-helix YgiT family protein
MVATNRCHNDDAVLVKGSYGYHQEVSGRTFTATLHARVCPVCGEKIVAYEDLHPVNLAVAKTLAKEGPIDGPSFRFMRKTLCMKATDLARLLDVTPETISKWENDKTPVLRSAWMVLTEMVLDEAEKRSRTLMRDRLADLAKGKRTRKHVRLDAA